jgi:hypothetical protein
MSAIRLTDGRRHPRGYAFAGVAALALGALAPSLAKAQISPYGSPGVSVGGAAKPLTFGIQETTTYDSDVARGNGTAAQVRGLEQADIIYAPSVTVNYAHSLGRQGLALKGYFGYDYYQRNKNLRAEHIDFSAAANKAIGSRCLVGGQAGYVRGQSGLEDLSLLVTKNVIQTYSVVASENCATATGLTEGLQVQHSAAQNSNSTLVDFDTTGVSGSIGYSNHTLGNISLVANYSKTSYDQNVGSLLGTPNSLEVEGIGIQFSRPIGMRLAGTAAVFYSTSNSDFGAAAVLGQKSSFDGVTANVGLTYLLGPRLHLGALLSRSVQPSIRQGVGLSISDQAGLTANYTVSSRISANLAANWSRQSFRGDVQPVTTQLAPDRVDLTSVSAGVSMKVGRTSALSADVHHEESSTDLALFNFKSDRVSLTLSTAF